MQPGPQHGGHKSASISFGEWFGVAFRVCWAEFGRDEYALNVLDVGCPSFVDLELSHLSI